MEDYPKLIALSSEVGKKLLGESQTSYNPHIHSCFRKQVGRSNCGIQSVALLLNSEFLAKGGNLSEVPYTESNMFSFDATTKIATQDYITGRGLSLQEVANVLKSHGKDVKTFHAADSFAAEFRNLAVKTLANTENGAGIIVNYHMGELGQGHQFGGHHSPLGAYHKESDRFLIFDTWPDTEECWAKTEDLFKAMSGIDTASGITRGYLVVCDPAST